MEARRLVLDTNVLVSGVLSPGGPPGRIVDLMVAGRIVPVVDSRVLCEYRDVLHRAELQLDPRRLQILLAAVERQAIRLVVAPWRFPPPDPDDEPFLALADAAMCPLVTGNARHFPPGSRGHVTVLSPARFIDSLAG